MLNLIKFELKLYNKIHQIFRSSIYIMLLTILLFSIILPESYMDVHKKMSICYAGLIFNLMLVPHYLIKIDMRDGFLETLLTMQPSGKVILAKYFALSINLLLSNICVLPIVILVFNLPFFELAYLYTLMSLTIFQIAILLVFINILHAYFKKNTNLLISLTLPLIIPTIIISSLAIESFKIDFLMIILGIDLILIPLIFCMANYLLKNLFNF